MARSFRDFSKITGFKSAFLKPMSMMRMSLLFNTREKNEKALLKFDWSFVYFEASTSLLARFVIIWM